VYQSQLEYRTELPSYLNHRLSYILLMVEVCSILFPCIATYSDFTNAQYLINNWSITPKTTTTISSNFVDMWKLCHRPVHHHHHPIRSQVIHFALYIHIHTRARTHTHTHTQKHKFCSFLISSMLGQITRQSQSHCPHFCGHKNVRYRAQIMKLVILNYYLQLTLLGCAFSNVPKCSMRKILNPVCNYTDYYV